MSGLPEGWERTDLLEVSEKLVDGSHNPPRKSTVGKPMLSARNVQNGKIIFDQYRLIREDDFDAEANRTRIQSNDVLLTIVGALGRSAVVSESIQPFTLQRSVAVISPIEGLYSEYLSRWFSSPAFQRWIFENAKGTAQKGVYLKKLGGSELPLPPLAEQKRIVAKLERLSARSGKAKEHLAAVQTLATRAKQATLAAAFRGALLGLETVPTNRVNSRCWDLPDGWEWKSFQDVATIKSNLRPPSEMQEFPHIAPDNIEGGTGRLLPYRTIAEDGVKSGKHHFFPGQIIYSKIRPYLRKAVTVDFEGACSADMYPVECGPDYDRSLLLQWLVSEDFAWFTSEHEGRSVLPKINQKALNSTPIPVPPLSEQTEIVRRIETAFAKIDRMVEEASRAADLLDRLDQQLLAKAFRGELVPQDPNDEPASALLARIREARANAPKPKRRRKSVKA